MKKRTFSHLLALYIISALACNSASNIVTTGAGPEDFSATVTSPVNVRLEWAAVAEATKYFLEVKYGNGDVYPLDELPSDQTSFDDYILPGTIQVTYHLIAQTGSGKEEIGTASVELPQAVPNPLVVSVKPYETVIEALPEFDPNNFDPNNFNPSDLFPPGFDPNNPEAFDPNSLVKSPPKASKEIGPDGGTMNLVDPQNISYELIFPPQAVEEPTVYTLTPVQSIDGFPLSGGMLGAVTIDPAFPLGVPAALTITLPAGQPPPSAPMMMGFAVDNVSSEFYLHPVNGSSNISLELNSPVRMAGWSLFPARQGSSTGMQVRGGGTYGVGSGTQGDVQTQSQRVPTDAGAQASQFITIKSSTRGDASSLGATGAQILHHLEYRSNDANSLTQISQTLEAYDKDGGFTHNNPANGRIIQKFVEKFKKLLDEAKGKCISHEDLEILELARKMGDPKSDFWRLAREAFIQHYGEKGVQKIKELLNGDKSCTFLLEFQATIDYRNDSGTARAVVRTKKPIRLLTTFMNNKYFLWGSGDVEYTKLEFHVPPCPITKAAHYPQVHFQVVEFTPSYNAFDKLADFELNEYRSWSNWVVGANVKEVAAADACVLSMNLFGGGDLWSGSFLLMHTNPGDNLTGWKPVEGATVGFYGDIETNFDPLVLTLEYKGKTYALSPPAGGTITENSTFKLTIQRNKK
jgi:hypothetical protein